jgi:hypothetical protein
MTCEDAVKRIEDEVLNVLKDLQSDQWEEWQYFYKKAITKRCTIDEIWVTVALKSLRLKGLVEFRRGLMNEDGEVAGAGYRTTSKAGIENE